MKMSKVVKISVLMLVVVLGSSYLFTNVAFAKKRYASQASQRPVCEYMRPPAGCIWVGMKPFPKCNAAHLECGLPTI
ncbi:MAG: hypothetical protein WC847_00420 [Candidatus Paceibacterota bacterium]|jgi:hypothetical protein